MATVKVKFRASTTEGKEGTFYYHLIHQRHQRWIRTHYHVFPEEWNDKRSAVIISDHSNRRAYLQLVQSKINREMKQMQRIIHDKEMVCMPSSIDDIAKEIRQLPPSRAFLLFSDSRLPRKSRCSASAPRTIMSVPPPASWSFVTTKTSPSHR